MSSSNLLRLAVRVISFHKWTLFNVYTVQGKVITNRNQSHFIKRNFAFRRLFYHTPPPPMSQYRLLLWNLWKNHSCIGQCGRFCIWIYSWRNDNSITTASNSQPQNYGGLLLVMRCMSFQYWFPSIKTNLAQLHIYRVQWNMIPSKWFTWRGEFLWTNR